MEFLERDPARRRRLLLAALSFGGVAFVLIQLIIGTQSGLFPIPGRDELIWDRVGDGVWTGASIYEIQPAIPDSFAYGPPWAVFFATLSWLPIVAQHFVFLALRIASLRVIAGSWVGAGIACWFPLVAFELGGGNFNLLMAASIVAATSRRPAFATAMAFAKFSPALAIDVRDWRRAGLIAAAMVGVTLPWLHLWPEWISHLIQYLGLSFGPQIPVPFPLRLLAAGLLLVISRNAVVRAIAATVAIPAFYWGSFVVFIAPVAVFIRNRFANQPATPSLAPAA